MARKTVLTEERLELLGKAAQTSPRLARNLAVYRRHTQRIRTLERVLDPEDKAANFNTRLGTEESLRRELERRQGELPRITARLLLALERVETTNGEG